MLKEMFTRKMAYEIGNSGMRNIKVFGRSIYPIPTTVGANRGLTLKLIALKKLVFLP